ncbi:MAG: class I SAM-dependent methyltransferase [Armatimonadetes bacterium]|nr:class I SAM-dependent methyltransferase [Armatimonadota bacterium]
MARTTKEHTQEIGLSIALILSRYFLKTDHLHYGFWTEDLPVEPGHLHQAQEKYQEYLIAHLPADTQTILEVGCGTGTLAKKLVDRGYEVECVSPSALLTERARELLGAELPIYECKFEDLEVEKQYDTLIFSESFQYVKLEKLVPHTYRYLKEGGSLLIMDFFSLPEMGKSPMGGGHDFAKFQQMMVDQRFESVANIDITAETAPTLDLAEDLIHQVIIPLKTIASEHLRSRYSVLYRSLHWLFRKKIQKLNTKYFSGTRNADTFLRHKTYRLMIYEKSSAATTELSPTDLVAAEL